MSLKALPTQTRALKKRRDLLDAALLEFVDKGFDATTAKSIAERAGVATGTFYQYFNNKDEMLLLVARERFAEVHANVRLPGIEQVDQRSGQVDISAFFQQVLSWIYDFHARDSRLHEVLEYRRSVDAALNEEMHKGEAILLERARQLVHAFGCANPEAVAFCLFAMAEGIVHRHVFHPQELSKAEVVEIGAQMLSAYFETLKSSDEIGEQLKHKAPGAQ